MVFFAFICEQKKLFCLFQDREPEDKNSHPEGLSLTGGDRRRYNPRPTADGYFLFVSESVAVGEIQKPPPKPSVKDGVRFQKWN